MKKRELIITTMTKEEYFAKYGEQYKVGDLWDYPIEEIDYIINDTEVEKVVLIDNRLYEIY